MATESDGILSVMVGAIFAVAGIAVLAPTLQQVFSALPSAQMLRAQAYYGMTDPRTLDANGTLKWLNLVDGPPYTPWISASFFNDGPDKVYIGINTPDGYPPIEKGESMSVDFFGADRKIETIFYWCDATRKAGVRVVGKY